MRKFVIYMVSVSLITLMMGYLLDIAYTYVFHHSLGRNKVDIIHNSEPRSYDLIFVGSSRAHNHMVPKLFEDRGISTFNYGMSGATLAETELMLRLFIERGHKTRHVILEADVMLVRDSMNYVIASMFLPYIHSSPSVRRHFSHEMDFNELYYVPFYRYGLYSSKIGFREMFLAAAGKSTNHLDHGGYEALYTKSEEMQHGADPDELLGNRYYDAIKKICKANNIELIVVTTPICDRPNTDAFFDRLRIRYPEIHHFEYVLPDNRYFASCGHLNDAGAHAFTKKLLDFYQTLPTASENVSANP